MKQGNRFYMPIKVDIDLDIVESIDFCFEQNGAKRYVTYPSSKTELYEGYILVMWNPADTWMFKANMPINIDTRIKLKDSQMNPDTLIATTKFRRTDFGRVVRT